MSSQGQRSSSEDDFRINGRMPPSSPSYGTILRGVMRYQQSPYGTVGQNRAYTSLVPSPGCGCDGDDDVFFPDFSYPMQSTPIIGTPKHGRFDRYYEGPMAHSQGSNSWDTPSLGSYRRPPSVKAPVKSPCWEANSRAGSNKYDYEPSYGEFSGWVGEASSYVSGQESPPPSYTPPMSGRSMLPSWPDSPDGNRRRGRLDRFDQTPPSV
ncbi:unnamed protein product [Candidula unifasciata]|uniref:Uncharacterized protein n=1 Tax=Candidula unifasciata TaxID=100452 RepID=A0A8S3YTB2_9EUPU|nr:unnamed protein product [Candidula unifasciata]